MYLWRVIYRGIFCSGVYGADIFVDELMDRQIIMMTTDLYFLEGFEFVSWWGW